MDKNKLFVLHDQPHIGLFLSFHTDVQNKLNVHSKIEPKDKKINISTVLPSQEC